MNERTPAEVFPPGEFIREEIEARGWSQIDLAEILGRPPRLISELIAGKRAVTPETAKGLGAAFGTGAQFWMNLESAYQLSRVRTDDHDIIARRAKIYEKAPVKEMIRRNWIEPTESAEVLEKRVCDFFGIQTIDEPFSMVAHAARMSLSKAALTSEQHAWLCRVRQVARCVRVSSYSRSKIDDLLPRLRALVVDPAEARHVPNLLAEAGIRFLIVEALAQTKIDGACLWLDRHSPVVALTTRFDRVDSFWFTLMHELAHVKNSDGMESALIDVDLIDGDHERSLQKSPVERQADEFAAEFLVPKSDLDDFVARVKPLYSKQRIRAFAARIHVHPGVVVGQLQYRRCISYSHSREMLAKVRGVITEATLTDGWGCSLPTMN